MKQAKWFLKKNEKILKEECDRILEVIIETLDINKRVDYLSKEKIEKNDFDHTF